MNKLKNTYVIVKQHEGHTDFFQDFVSNNKVELNSKCEQLNKEINDGFKKNSKKNNLPFISLEVYVVMSLKDAVAKFGEEVANYWNDSEE